MNGIRSILECFQLLPLCREAFRCSFSCIPATSPILCKMNEEESLSLFAGSEDSRGEGNRWLATNHFIEERKMVVLCFPQCHRHGWSWSPQSSLCYGITWMVLMFFAFISTYYVRLSIISFVISLFLYLVKFPNLNSGDLVWLYLSYHGSLLCILCGKWLKCMKWFPGSVSIDTMNWVSMHSVKSSVFISWYLNSWSVKLVWT